MNNKEIIFCSNRNCEKKNDCLRYFRNEPFDVMVKESKWKLNSKGECEGYMR